MLERFGKVTAPMFHLPEREMCLSKPWVHVECLPVPRGRRGLITKVPLTRPEVF